MRTMRLCTLTLALFMAGIVMLVGACGPDAPAPPAGVTTTTLAGAPRPMP
jgi:hypothetical protein